MSCHSMLISQLSGLVHNSLNKLWSKSSENTIEKLSLCLLGCSPVIGHIVQEVSDSCSLWPNCPTSKLRPTWNENCWDMLSLDHLLFIFENLLHESQRASTLLGKEELHVVKQVPIQVLLALYKLFRILGY